MTSTGCKWVLKNICSQSRTLLLYEDCASTNAAFINMAVIGVTDTVYHYTCLRMEKLGADYKRLPNCLETVFPAKFINVSTAPAKCHLIQL